MKKKINENYYSDGPYTPNRYKNLSYAKASPDKKYIQILKYFYDNGEADRTTAVMEVFKDTPPVAAVWNSDKPRQTLRGYAVTYFGQLVNDGLLNVKKDGKYTLFSLTPAGEELLRSCGAI